MDSEKTFAELCDEARQRGFDPDSDKGLELYVEVLKLEEMQKQTELLKAIQKNNYTL